MEVKVKLHTVIIQDRQTYDEYAIRTVRTAEEIAEELEQSEKEALIDRLHEVACEVYTK
jgi:hypothetical protein